MPNTFNIGNVQFLVNAQNQILLMPFIYGLFPAGKTILDQIGAAVDAVGPGQSKVYNGITYAQEGAILIQSTVLEQIDIGVLHGDHVMKCLNPTKRINLIALVLVFAAFWLCWVASVQPSTQPGKDKIDPKVVKAWEKAGALVGWYGNGKFSGQKPAEYAAVPAFRWRNISAWCHWRPASLHFVCFRSQLYTDNR